ncbi:MAG TPA: NAD(P)-dependent oxidoreductase [Candidatus Saccharimonadales bacterium]|nr:NAD(P)-dependent oxidoreductase [Candidatus Saccharimonadales bacterium]
MTDEEIFIAGANGQLGRALKARYPGARSADVNELDITKRDSVLNYDWSGIKVLLNAAAFTNVDGAETAEGRVAAWKVNATAVSYLVEAAAKHDLTLVHVSTDYVFDGTHDNHTEDEPFSPLGVYAQTKAAGDIAVSLAPKHYILRASWVIGEGPNFVRTMLGLAAKGVEPTVVADQIGRLTFTTELVKIIDHLLTTQAPYGTYNATNGGEPASWADITRAIFQEAGYELQVTDTTTEEYFKDKPGIAPRPLKSTLALDKLQAAGFTPRDWRNDLADYIAKEKQA